MVSGCWAEIFSKCLSLLALSEPGFHCGFCKEFSCTDKAMVTSFCSASDFSAPPPARVLWRTERCRPASRSTGREKKCCKQNCFKFRSPASEMNLKWPVHSQCSRQSGWGKVTVWGAWNPLCHQPARGRLTCLGLICSCVRGQS